MSSEGTLLFDGDCGFCTWVVGQARRWLRPRATIVHWQGADLGALGVTAQECANSIQFVYADGTHVAEGRAVAALLKSSSLPWPAVGRVVEAPGVIALADAAYRLVARNRYRLPGSTPACQLPAPSAPRTSGDIAAAS